MIMAQLFSLLSPLYPLPSLNRVIRKAFIQTVVLVQPAAAGAGGIQCGTSIWVSWDFECPLIKS